MTLKWNSFKVRNLLQNSRSEFADQAKKQFIRTLALVLSTLSNWLTLYFKEYCWTISSAATLVYSSDVLCMFELFCLFALSPRSHIKANLSKWYTHKLKLKDNLYEAFTSSYLPRYLCHLSRAFRWLRRSPALSILTGRCSARRSDRGHTSRCCCTAQGSRLSTYNAHVRM